MDAWYSNGDKFSDKSMSTKVVLTVITIHKVQTIKPICMHVGDAVSFRRIYWIYYQFEYCGALGT